MSDAQASTTSSQPTTLGNWITQTINGMQYEVLLPANYNPSVQYPTVLYLHQLDMGNDPTDLLNTVNGWFNTATFRTDYPSIVVMPLLDQSADWSGETINWGGISAADSAGETNALAALKQVTAQYSTDPSRIYVTGNSMGGIGTEDMLIRYNAYTGTEGKIFAGGLAFAGTDYAQGYPEPNASVVSGLKNVPFWAIHGGQDTTVSPTFDQNLYAAEQAIGGDMKYTQVDSLGHDVWDTYYPQTGPSSPLGWLFSQSTAGGVTPTGPTPVPGVSPSANDTVVTGTSAAITDAGGNKWTITSGGQVAVNGVADTSTAGVVELAYVNGAVWQENASKLWWGSTSSPTPSWSLGSGTSASPVPVTPPPPKASPNNIVVTGTSAAITDAGGNKWTITSGGQVAVNGVADASTAGVVELAYVNGAVWQENASKLWWGSTSSPTPSWSLGSGTSTSPVPVTPPPPKPSPNNTVVTGTSAAITDAGGNKWTITSGGQVAVNGVADASTAGVVELAYVNGAVWQENASKLWWGSTSSPTPSWSLGSGTSTSPVPVTPPPPKPSPNDTVVTGTSAAITDAGGNNWTITSGGQVAVNGVADTSTTGVVELAYVNGAVWQENASKLWWGSTSSPTPSWSLGSGTSTGPVKPIPTPTPAPAPVSTPTPTPIVTPSAAGTVVQAGSVSVIVDAGGNKWSITSNGQVAVNGKADTSTANVVELAYVHGTVWQENSSKLWWGTTSAPPSWSLGGGTSSSPLPSSVTIPQANATYTVSQSQISVAATAGNHMVFVSGTGDTLNLSGGTETITDSGHGNTYVLPAANHGMDAFTTDILANGNTLDLHTALAATDWNGSASTLSGYLHVTNSGQGVTLSVAAKAGGTPVAIASTAGASDIGLTTLLAHAIV